MAFVSEMVDQLRSLLNDAADTQVTYATKKLFLNRGISLLWPAVRRVTSYTQTLTQSDVSYSLPAAIADGYILSVELSTDNPPDIYVRLQNYDVLPGDEDQASFLYIGDARLVADGVRTLRVTYAAPIPLIAAASYAASQSETFLGPDRALHLPVLYAMGMLTQGKIDDRQDTLRYSTTQATNGVTDTDILSAAQVWLNQFYAELEQLTRPLPPTRD